MGKRLTATFHDAIAAATKDVFEIMLGCEVTAHAPLSKGVSTPRYEMAGLVALTGETEGVVALTVNRSLLQHAGTELLGAKLSSEAEETDLVAELTNMIAGRAKSSLGIGGIYLGIPTVIVGRSAISCGSKLPSLVIPFECEWGSFAVEVASAVAAVEAGSC